MIINLNCSVEPKEFAEISISGVVEANNTYMAEIAFSKAALIGFATNLLWMYDEIDNSKRFHIHIDPLCGTPAGNQALGFFLTPQSPSLVVAINNLQNSHHQAIINNYTDIYIRNEISKRIEIKEPACNESIEEYELGFTNIASIRIFNSDNVDITADCPQVLLQLNYEGLKHFATMLLVLANNYKNGCEYPLAHSKQKEFRYNMGVIFNESSCKIVLKCDDLGCVYDYDTSFGQLN